MTQGAIFLFFKNENVIFSLNLFSMTWNKRQNSMSSAGKFPHALPHHIFFFFAFDFKKHMKLANDYFVQKKEKKY